MLIKKNREKRMPYIGAAAQVALVLGISMGYLDNPGLDFITGRSENRR